MSGSGGCLHTTAIGCDLSFNLQARVAAADTTLRSSGLPDMNHSRVNITSLHTASSVLTACNTTSCAVWTVLYNNIGSSLPSYILPFILFSHLICRVGSLILSRYIKLFRSSLVVTLPSSLLLPVLACTCRSEVNSIMLFLNLHSGRLVWCCPDQFKYALTGTL